jgi:hypothetical protein
VGNDSSFVDVVSDLPADAPARRKTSRALPDNRRLLFEVALQGSLPFILLAYVVRGRRDNELQRFIRDMAEQVEAISGIKNDAGRWIEPLDYFSFPRHGLMISRERPMVNRAFPSSVFPLCLFPDFLPLFGFSISTNLLPAIF